MKDDDDRGRKAKLAAIRKYVSTDGVPLEALMKMAKLGAVIDGWMAETECRHQRGPVLDLAGRISSAWCPAP